MSTLAGGRVFACDIESALPYSEISLAKSDGAFGDDAMIDKERVVLLTGLSDSVDSVFTLRRPENSLAQP